jgi:hypothetical protein
MGTMTTSTGEVGDSRALDAFAEVLLDGATERSAEDLDHGLQSLLARVEVERTQRRRAVRWSLAAATLALCVLGGAYAASRLRAPLALPESPSYRIEGGSVLDGGYLRESGHAGVKLFFHEGSKLVLMPGTRGRLRALDAAGGRVAIEQGTASFQVVPSADRRWFVEVGPFVVTVKGTVFSVSWDPSSERFELQLRHGRVVVSGPISGGDIVLRAGQRLVVSLAKAETLILDEKLDDNAAEPDSAPAPSTAPAAVAAPLPHDRASVAPASATKVETARDWAAQLARGHWDRILADVDRAGQDAALNRASSDDLLALADAARYRRRTDLARAALLAERRRFPRSAGALDALFLLGRVEESDERGTTRAIAWYDEYLARAPGGAYSAEALGRKMTLTHEQSGRQAARPLAEEYLRRFPKGSYAGPARALREGP